MVVPKKQDHTEYLYVISTLKKLSTFVILSDLFILYNKLVQYFADSHMLYLPQKGKLPHGSFTVQ